MKILVINGDCVLRNSSANLCHLAYLRGLVDSGHEVTLLCASSQDYKVDQSMQIPKQVKCYTYYGVSFYERLSLKKRNALTGTQVSSFTASNGNSGEKIPQRVIKAAKQFVLSLYGVHGIYAKFVKVAQQFRSDEVYDCIISISTPVTSHLLAYNLLKANHIKGKRWIQIWEDPWYSDVHGLNSKKQIYQEEKRLLSFAERVCYVSPLTLKNQQQLFPESADKMFWQPLPYYYKETHLEPQVLNHNVYGYFGAYYPTARDLAPFYHAAKETGVEVNICGDPSGLFAPTENIHIHSRLPLNELKPIEDNTNVLIFLCNRKGGQIPGKIYQYSATNKIILFIMDGTEEEQNVLKDFFGKFNRYVFCQNTEEDIAQAIRRIESGDLGRISNRPLEEFDPQTTIRNILNG